MRCFFDTGILIHAWDEAEATKRARARTLIEQAIEHGSFVVSTQVLMEFHATAVRRRLLGPPQALELVGFWSEQDAVALTPDLLARGLALQQEHALSIWAGPIVQAALDARCELLLTEDLPHGRRFGQLEVRNPFLGGVPHEPAAPGCGTVPARTLGRRGSAGRGHSLPPHG